MYNAACRTVPPHARNLMPKTIQKFKFAALNSMYFSRSHFISLFLHFFLQSHFFPISFVFSHFNSMQRLISASSAATTTRFIFRSCSVRDLKLTLTSGQSGSSSVSLSKNSIWRRQLCSISVSRRTLCSRSGRSSGNREIDLCAKRTLTKSSAPAPNLALKTTTTPEMSDSVDDTPMNLSTDQQKVMNHYILPLDQPVVTLECEQAFNGLTDKEKLYAHWLGRASWYGGLATIVQTSPESPAIFALLHDMFKSNTVEGLKTLAINQCGFTEDEWKALTVYTAGVFSYAGNYKSFGDTKIILGVPLNKIDSLVQIAKFDGLKQGDAQSLWNSVKDKVYSLSDREKQLGLGEQGITTYFSSNCDTSDAEFIGRFLKKQNLEPIITRAFKHTEPELIYEIRSASADLNDESNSVVHEFEGKKLTLTKGDYSPIMQKVCEYLGKAKEFASNETEVNMLNSYIQSFKEGSLDAHKEGSRFWIKDKEPPIETYIGFIETYRDPNGARGEFEGFVSIVNRPMSAKFQTLVDRAKDFLPLLPWPKAFERDVFMKPDFTSLDVLVFSGSGIPAGINIPNYDEIRNNEGFKNVSLGNVIPASYKDSNLPFLSDEDKDLLNKYRIPAFEVQVGLHELLGHGSGLMFTKDAEGKTNFPADLKNPLTGDLVEGHYEPGETWTSVFTTLSSPYEECKAECVGLLLSLEKEVLKVFGHEGEEAEDVIYTNWLSMAFAGAAKALEMYQSDAGAWMQAHSQARFVILQVLLEAGEGLLEIAETTGTDGRPDLLIKLDRTKINTVGRKAINDFLLKLQVYKSTADLSSGRKMFEGYSAVNNDGRYPWASWRDIILEKKQPRKMFVQHNTVLSDKEVGIKSYPSSPEGLIQSWIERFSENNLYADLVYCWQKDKPYFNY